MQSNNPFPRVVTGKNNSSTAAHVGRVTWLKLVPLVWGWGGVSCPKGYKYDGRAF